MKSVDEERLSNPELSLLIISKNSKDTLDDYNQKIVNVINKLSDENWGWDRLSENSKVERIELGQWPCLKTIDEKEIKILLHSADKYIGLYSQDDSPYYTISYETFIGIK